MFCPKCGSENSDTNKFCKKCGKNLPSRAEVGRQVAQVYTAQQTVPLVGQILDGRYRIEAKLGAGGMGDVYRATRLLVGDEIAVKILHPHLAADAQSAERFRREAVTATRLRHRNIVAIYDVGISAAYNLPYILMELADGFTLRQVINQYRVLPLEFAVTVTAQLCSALEEAHSLGIVHRDIKPENIVVRQTDSGWRVKVLDFGIAKLYEAGAEESLTLDGTAMGTPQYMSPEQCLGEALDGRSDIYSAGIVLYEMLCGTVPFKSPAASAVAVFQVQNQPAPPRSHNQNIHPQVEQVVLRALEKQREMRQQTAQALAQELIEAATAAYRDGGAPKPEAHITPSDLETVSSGLLPENEFTPSHTLSSDLLIENDTANDSSELAITEHVEKTSPTACESLPPEYEKDPEEIELREKAELTHVFEDAESLLDTVFTDGAKDESLENSGATEVVTAVLPAAQVSDRNQPIAVPSELLPAAKKHNFATEAKTELLVFEPKQVSLDRKNGILIGGIVALLIIFMGIIAGSYWTFSGGEPVKTDGANPSAPDSQTATEGEISGSKKGENIKKSPPAPEGMVFIPGGEFMMGSDTGDEYSRPAHKVSVTPFFIDLTEVTNEDYKKFVDAAGHRPPPDWKDGNYPAGKARFPVTGVDWDDANAYARWAGKRLPTEAEWEFAARGTENRIYPWGNEWKKGFANAENQNRGMQEVGKAEGKSPFGLLDMSGNAWEWTASEAKAYPNGKAFPKHRLKLKIIRGGSWKSKMQEATAVFRGYWGANGEAEYNYSSFRCVKDF